MSDPGRADRAEVAAVERMADPVGSGGGGATLNPYSLKASGFKV